MNILAVDTGYGDCKVIYGDSNGNINKLFKFPSVVAPVVKNEMITDNRLLPFEDSHWYVGTDALQVESSQMISMVDYEKLQAFAPLFIIKSIIMACPAGEVPDVVVVGLSISQISMSGAYKARISSYLNSAGINAEVLCFPQGAVAKIAVDKYGAHFPQPVTDFMGNTNYVLADIGFNTLDICQVINGKTSPNLVRGIERQGAVLIVEELIKQVESTTGIKLSVPEGKDALMKRSFKRRGTTYDLALVISDIRKSYVTELKKTIEREFGSVLDKVDSLFIVGGGTYLVNPNDSEVNDGGFIKGASESAEFYNSIGEYLLAVQQNK